jgi:hypothetical protein
LSIIVYSTHSISSLLHCSTKPNFIFPRLKIPMVKIGNYSVVFKKTKKNDTPFRDCQTFFVFYINKETLGKTWIIGHSQMNNL